LLDDETPSALALAQKVRGLVTKAIVGHWCPRATEQEIRDKIMDLQTLMMSQGESEVHNTYRLAELTQNLQSCWSPNDTWHSGDHQESPDAMKYLQYQLKQEMEEHIREGKGNVEKVQERVGRIQQLKEALREEALK
ncbi:hypothetical protein INR49_024375, partial [Caranx melampygus]